MLRVAAAGGKIEQWLFSRGAGGSWPAFIELLECPAYASSQVDTALPTSHSCSLFASELLPTIELHSSRVHSQKPYPLLHRHHTERFLPPLLRLAADA